LTDTIPTFGIGSPLFDRITIKLSKKYYSGNEFVIETENNSRDNMYIGSMTVNGRVLNKTFIPFSTLVKGGKMSIQMSNIPRDKY
jgi:putative alpha-1,2-mannosidase